jgi:IclR family KDG regulon transcriptional repressor
MMQGVIQVRRLSTLYKASKVLALFSPEQPEWGVSEAAKASGLPRSTAAEILSSLADQGILRRTAARRYRLGWRLFELSQTLLDTSAFYQVAHREMQEIINRSGETSHLTVLADAQALYIEKLAGVSAMPIPITRVGGRLPAHSTGVGKLLLAHREWQEIAPRLADQGLRAFTPNTITTLDKLAIELKQARKQGYAYDHEETLPGLCCVAAPIYGQNGSVIASISSSIPAGRFYPYRARHTSAILQAAQRISEYSAR